MVPVGRILIITGIALVIIGLLSYGLPLFRLPGDIKYDGEQVKFYFPIVTCIIISIVLTILFNLFRR
jgi:hypothetical protein